MRETRIPSVKTIAEKVEALGLKCHWCQTPIKATDVNFYYPHSGGVAIKETYPEKAWVYFTCSGPGCGYDWSLAKLLRQAKK